ncbi:MAG: guanylate kinase [Ruminococcus sp.]|nr:guanylate kinase [Ruminococcus sp.]
MSKGRLIVFSAPSGCGKGTMLAEILKDDSFYLSVSATTRAPREGEVDGENYHFLTKEKFEELIANDGVLEYAKYCDNYYGTPLKPVEDYLNAGKNVILEIEVQGAMKVKERMPDALMIFVLPPSVGELRRRLEKRGTESLEVIEKRVSAASDEIKCAEKYDYVIVNDALEDAVNDFKAVIKAEKQKTKYAGELIDEVIKNA